MCINSLHAYGTDNKNISAQSRVARWENFLLSKKIIMKKPFWEKTYTNENVTTFGIEPNKTIFEKYIHFIKDCNILEVGCGEGKNALFLAQKGFSVDAFDISKAGIDKLKRIAAKNNIDLNAWVQDLCAYKFNKQYGVITSHGVFHFVNKENWKKFILCAKENTVSKGIHIMQIFTNKIPASPDIAPFIKGLANENELFDLYNDWNILEKKSYIFEDIHPGVEKHFHAANKIVAIKPEWII